MTNDKVVRKRMVQERGMYDRSLFGTPNCISTPTWRTMERQPGDKPGFFLCCMRILGLVLLFSVVPFNCYGNPPYSFCQSGTLFLRY